MREIFFFLNLVLAMASVRVFACALDMTEAGELIRHLQLYAHDLRSKQGVNYRLEDLSPGTDKIRVIHHGVPSYLKWIDVDPDRVFRFYFKGTHGADGADLSARDIFETIISQRAIRAGVTAYVASDYPVRFRHEQYPALTGVFLTLPECPGPDVGVIHEAWIDVRLFAETPMIQLEHNRIYLIPGKTKEDFLPIREIVDSSLSMDS